MPRFLQRNSTSRLLGKSSEGFVPRLLCGGGISLYISFVEQSAMTDSHYQIVLASDPELIKKVDHLLEQRTAFIIRVDKIFRHRDRIIRTIRLFYEGEQNNTKFNWWTRYLDIFYSGDIFECWGQEDKHYYNSYYVHTLDGIDLMFDPPAH
jgi:hypothetical protein